MYASKLPAGRFNGVGRRRCLAEDSLALELSDNFFQQGFIEIVRHTEFPCTKAVGSQLLGIWFYWLGFCFTWFWEFLLVNLSKLYFLLSFLPPDNFLFVLPLPLAQFVSVKMPTRQLPVVGQSNLRCLSRWSWLLFSPSCCHNASRCWILQSRLEVP